MSDVPMPQGLSQEAVAEWLHDDYERSARAVGWKTQEACRVPFADLPVANQQVMLMTARAVLALVAQERSRAIADATAQVEAKVREGVALTRVQERAGGWTDDDAVVTVVMNKEATNG